MSARTVPQAKTISTSNIRSDILNDVFCKRRIHSDNKQQQRVREKLLHILLELNVSQFEALTALLLQSLAYEDVQIMRQTMPQRRSHKGRNSHGGYDLSAHSSTFSPSMTLVQTKQYKRPVSRRFVDELRGAMVRQSAQGGLLVTTSRFPVQAEFSARENALLPITLIDGERLLDLLFCFSLGVQQKQGEYGLRWRIDRSFFRRLIPADKK